MSNNKSLAENESRALSVVESMLFASDKPVSIGQLSKAIEQVDQKIKIKAILEKYKLILEDDSRGVYLENIAGKYQIRTKKINSDILKNINKTKTFKLSNPALEALSVIAYEGPLIKARVDEVRNIDSGHLIRLLMDKGLVCFAGKSELPGKPMLYKTTQKFLEIFSLESIKNLPDLSEVEELIPDVAPHQEKQALSDFMSNDNLEDENLDEDLSKVNEDLSKIKIKKLEAN